MKYCTHCGAEIPAGAKFCVTCGQPVQSKTKAVPTQPDATVATKSTVVTTTPTKVTEKAAASHNGKDQATTVAVNPEVAARINDTKKFATNYWRWLVTSLKAPFATDQRTHAYFGVVSFVLLALINALSFYVLLRHFEQAVIADGVSISSIGELFGLSTTGTSLFTFGTFLKFVFLYLIIYAGAILISYVMQIGSQHITIFDYTNRYAHTSNYVFVPALIALLVAFLSPTTVTANSSDVVTAFLSSIPLFIGALLVESIVLHIGMIASVLKTTQEKFDRIYRALGAVILTGIFNYIVLDLALQSVITALGRSLNLSDFFE